MEGRWNWLKQCELLLHRGGGLADTKANDDPPPRHLDGLGMATPLRTEDFGLGIADTF